MMMNSMDLSPVMATRAYNRSFFDLHTVEDCVDGSLLIGEVCYMRN